MRLNLKPPFTPLIYKHTIEFIAKGGQYMWNIFIVASLISVATLGYTGRCSDELIATPTSESFVVPPIEKSHIVSGNGSEKRISLNKKYNLLVWNIYKGFKGRLYSDLDNLLLKSDFSLLQEIMLYKPEADNFYKEKGNYEWNFAISFFNRDNHATGVSSVSRFESTKSKIYRSKFTEPFVNTPKMSLVQKFDIDRNNEQLLMINIHAINFVHNQKFYRQLEPLVNEIKSHSGPVIFAGDFNTHNPWRERYLIKALESLGLRRLKLNGDRRLISLDHVFVRGVNIHTSVLRTDINSSDHLPIFVEFELSDHQFALSGFN